MWTIFISCCAVIFIIVLICLLVRDVREKKTNPPQEIKETHTRLLKATCNRCNRKFYVSEKDALAQYDYGTKFLIACPHCGKLMKVKVKEE